LATNFQDLEQVDLPLRQLLVNTHSPSFISQPDARNALLFAYTATRVEPADRATSPQRITRIVQVEKANEVLKQLKLDFEYFKEYASAPKILANTHFPTRIK